MAAMKAGPIKESFIFLEERREDSARLFNISVNPYIYCAYRHHKQLRMIIKRI